MIREPVRPKFKGWNPAMAGAFKKGYLAAMDHKLKEANPYADLRKWDGKLTWSRAFIRCWDDGYDTACSDRAGGDNDGFHWGRLHN